MQSKKCLYCGRRFYKPVNETQVNWVYRHKFCSLDCRYKSQKGKKPKYIPPPRYGENHHLWKGRKVGYFALHAWVIRNLGKPNKCVHCGSTTAKQYHWANKSGKYRRNLGDWIRLCVNCHLAYDKTAFKKGHLPWNKGIKTGLIPRTAFKKGLVPWNKGLKGYKIKRKLV